MDATTCTLHCESVHRIYLRLVFEIFRFGGRVLFRRRVGISSTRLALGFPAIIVEVDVMLAALLLVSLAVKRRRASRLTTRLFRQGDLTTSVFVLLTFLTIRLFQLRLGAMSEAPASIAVVYEAR